MDITTLRTRYFDAAAALGSADFACERGWEPPSAVRAARVARDAAFEAYAAALAELRDDDARFEAFVRGMFEEGEPLERRRRKRDMRHGLWWDWLQQTCDGWTPSVHTRIEQPEDQAVVDALVEAAFESVGERDLVRALRGEPGVVSVVAERGGDVVGHAMLSPVHTGEGQNDCALAPVAVRPDAQRRGVGSALVQASLRAAWEAEHRACFVLGEPAYYGAWFRKAAPRWTCPWPGSEDALQVAFRSWAAADGWEGGALRYHPAFGQP